MRQLLPIPIAAVAVAVMIIGCGAAPEAVNDSRPMAEPSPTAAATTKEPPIRFPRPAPTAAPSPAYTPRPAPTLRPTRYVARFPTHPPRPTRAPAPTVTPAQPLCTCISHQEDAGTLFALDGASGAFYEGIYAISLEDGADARVGDVERFGIPGKWPLNPNSIGWDGCRMWMVAGTDLYTVDMQTGIAVRRATLTNDRGARGVSSLTWDGRSMYAHQKGLVTINMRFHTVKAVDVARHPPSASMHAHNRLTWGDGSMYSTNGITRISVVDLERGHLARHVYDNKVTREGDRINDIVWADGRLHYHTLSYGFGYINEDGYSEPLFVLMGPTDPFDGSRSGQLWMDFAWVPGDEGRC